MVDEEILNVHRRLEKLVAEEEIKERKLFNSYLPEQEREDMVALDEINHTIPAKTSNFTARRSSAPIYESHSMKKKGKNHRRQRSAYRSLSKRRNKKKLVKTPEEYEEEWQRRQDSPYTRRHSEMITGKSANEMMFSSANLSLSSSSIDIAVDFCNLRKKLKSQQETKKRKFDMIRGNVEFSMKKKLKLTLKLAGETFKTGNYRYESEEDEDDELDDPDWKESGQGRRKTKKSGRNGKDLGHRRNSSEDLDDNLPPSTARYLESLRAPYARAVGSEQISERELQALSLAARGNTSTSSPARISVPRSSSSSTSTLVDLREDSEPGWEVKSRTPLSTRSLSHASSRSNSNLLSRPSSSSSSGIHRPALRRERTSIHLNAFFIGVPADIAASVLLPNGVLSQEDIPVPQHDFQLDYANLSSDISATSEQQEIDDDDEFILGILSPERKLPPIEEEQEPSIFAETCPELDELSSSPEDLDDDVGHQHKSVGPPSGQAQEEGRETCEGGDAVAITNAEEAQEQGDGIEENQSNSDAVGKGVDEADLKLKPPSALLARPEDLFDDEAVAEEARSDEAIIRRLRSSIALGLDMIVEEEESNDVDFVQGLLEQFGMRVNRPGSPAPKDPVIFPVKKESSYKNTTAIEHEKLKISDNKSKGSEYVEKTHSFSSLIEMILTLLTMWSPYTLTVGERKR